MSPKNGQQPPFLGCQWIARTVADGGEPAAIERHEAGGMVEQQSELAELRGFEAIRRPPLGLVEFRDQAGDEIPQRTGSPPSSSLPTMPS